MQLLNKQQKQQVSGGAFSAAAWVAIIGVGLLMASVTSLINTLTTSSSNQTGQLSHASGQRPTASIRMSAVPSRSSVSFWI